MQLHHAGVDVKSSGIVQTAQAQVRMNATAFKILSSGLYSDKIGAVLREIGCNAADAHVDAGTPDLPIRVKLPTALSPAFSIKDWGPGLSHDDVMNNYQTYFHSTKASSNDVTGCFGLGSKSPYAYTDQFTVVTAQNGQQRTYFCAFDATGVPTTSLVNTCEAPSDWQHGLEVSLPVRTSDVQEFVNKADATFRWFRVPPTIYGGNIKPMIPEWTVGRFAHLPQHTIYQPMLIMGNVAYPFDTNTLNPGWNATAANKHMAEMLNVIYAEDLLFHVPIGTVDVTASRESIEYTDRTKKALLDLLENELKELATTVESKLTAPGPVSLEWIYAVLASLGSKKAATTIAKMQRGIAKYLPTKYHAMWKAVTEEVIHVEGWEKLQEDYVNEKTHPTATIWAVDSNGKRRSYYFRGSVPIDGNTEVVINDVPKCAAQRMRHFLDGSKDRRLLVLGHQDSTKLQEVVDILEKNPIPINYVRASALPKPPPRVRVAGNTAFGPIVRLKGDARLANVVEIGVDNLDTIPQLGYEPSKQVAVRDIPVGERFYIARTASWGRRALELPYSSRYLNARQFYNALATLKVGGAPVPKYIVIDTASQIKNRKLEEAGFKDIKSWYDDVLAPSSVVAVHRAALSSTTIANISSASYGDTTMTRELFKAAVASNAIWRKVQTAFAGKDYLTELEALVAEYTVLKNDAAAAAKGGAAGAAYKAMAGALRSLGIEEVKAPTITTVNFDEKIEALNDKYEGLCVLDSRVLRDGAPARKTLLIETAALSLT